MLYEKDVNETRRRELISAAIKVIAENGLENTATNMICAESGINVAYIYRFFESKEDLIAKSFEYVDDEFLGVILENFHVLNYYSIDFEMRCRVLFMKCWDFLMTHKEQTVFYVRYYYSSSFQKVCPHRAYAALQGAFEKNEDRLSRIDRCRLGHAPYS